MSSTVIKVENVSKQYRLGKVGTNTMAHDLKRWWHVVRGKEDPYLKLGEENDRTKKGISDYVWALRDISFEVKQGDVLGIIGRNGAGKSTLLKILSRTTSPTTGRIRVKGRIASLLEVGTGFHPDLSGRENTFLNGSILGMTKAEINRKFDAIVDFAGVEKYIDTPVKRYSSGMYVRLAFAVAAHLEPEILIVDEVLAVGDVEFQKKALGKMDQVAGGGRTVIFVSHNIGALRSLCKTGVVLVNGQMKKLSSIDEAIDSYNNIGGSMLNCEYSNFVKTDKPSFQKINITQSERQIEIFDIDKPIEIDFQVFTNNFDKDIGVTLVIRNARGDTLIHSSDEFSEQETSNNTISEVRNYRCIIPAYFLNAGDYFATFALSSRIGREIFEKLNEVLRFKVNFVGKLSEVTTASQWKGLTGPGAIPWFRLD